MSELSIDTKKCYEEEKITALWTICAVLSFGFDFDLAGMCFTIKAIIDFMCALKYAKNGIFSDSKE